MSRERFALGESPFRTGQPVVHFEVGANELTYTKFSLYCGIHLYNLRIFVEVNQLPHSSSLVGVAGQETCVTSQWQKC